MKAITIKTLLSLALEQVKLGNGEREIYLATDDEGNDFRPMFYGFTEDVEEFKWKFKEGDNETKIILG